MTDLEITKLCAEAMGYRLERYEDGRVNGWRIYVGDELVFNLPEDGGEWGLRNYDPLHDDSRTMALVKKFELWIQPPRSYPWGTHTHWFVAHGKNGGDSKNDNLNRAICECVAKMEKAKTG